MTGYAVAGPVGAVLGAAKGIEKVSKGIDKLVGKDNVLGGALQGAQTGTMVAGLGKAIGLNMSTTGSQIGGAIGSAIPIPGGEIIGSVLGGLVGNMFKKAKFGTSVIGMSGGALGSTTDANSSKYNAAASGAAGSVISGLQQIAEALGGDLTGAPSVSIGQYKDKWRVSTTGYAGKLDYKGASSQGLYNFDGDQAAAIAFAIGDALQDGVITGISAASKKILAAGGDLEKAIDKAVMIESIPKLLRQRLDPLGFAIDAVNDKYAEIVAALNEGGASAEQMAQAQQLYNLELADAKANTAAASQTLKNFLDDLKLGSDSPFSLRDQESAAREALAPYLDKIARGEAIDQGGYTEAAQRYLEVERQLYGSTESYFKEFERIQAATAKAIEKIDNAKPISTPTQDPFTQATAKNTEAAADIAAEGNQLMSEAVALLQKIASTSNTGGAPFLGGPRSFAA